jgi:hypothetical protein
MKPSPRTLTTLAIAVVFSLQLASTCGWIGHMSVLPFHGSVDLLLGVAADHGVVVARWAQRGIDVLFSSYWGFLLFASSPLAIGVPPPPGPGEEARHFRQMRAALAPEVALLLAAHLLDTWLAMNGWWLLQLPFEICGSLGEALLIYMLLIDEARPMLTVIVDVEKKGYASRLHISGGMYPWHTGLSLRHDHLRGVRLSDPFWSRIVDTAHLVFAYLDDANRLQHFVFRGAAPKRYAAYLCSQLHGAFRDGRPLPWTLPPSYNMGQHASHSPPDEPAQSPSRHR